MGSDGGEDEKATEPVGVERPVVVVVGVERPVIVVVGVVERPVVVVGVERPDPLEELPLKEVEGLDRDQ